MAASTPWRWLVPVGLVLLCLAAYANSFDTGFALDNRQLILNDPRVHAATRENLSLIVGRSYWWPYGESGLYRPLTTASYLFNYGVLGNADRPAGYHWVNLLLHTGNVLMVWLLVLRITVSRWTAATTAAIWAVLPLSTEAVTNIVGRADVMAATGSLAAVLLYLGARDDSHVAADLQLRRASSGMKTRRYVRVGGVALAVTVGVLSKESAIAVVGVLLLCEVIWWTPGRSLRRLATMAVVCTVPLALWAAERHAVMGSSGTAEFPFTDNPMVGAGFWRARLTAVHVLWRYLTLLAWPAHLSNDYSYPQIPLATGTAIDWLGCLLLVGGALAALWQLRRNRPALFFAGFALITILPASNLLFATGTIMGERLVYLPSVGIAGLVAMALQRSATTSGRRWTATGVAVLVVLASGARTYARNPDWTSDVTLWRTAVVAAPANAKAHRALAEALYATDPTHANIDAVIAEADRSVALLDELPDEQNTVQAFRQAGAYYLDKANRTVSGPDSDASPDLRRLYSRSLNLLDRAVMIASAGASHIPGASTEPEADAQRLRAAAILGMGNPSLALVAAKRSRQLSPLNALAYHLSAAALLEMNREDEAAITLLTGSIVSSEGSLGQEAMTLYASGLDPDGCAVSGAGAAAALNPRCPIVVRHSCVASAAAFQILTRMGNVNRAEQIKSGAISSLGCPAGLMDRPNSIVP